MRLISSRSAAFGRTYSVRAPRAFRDRPRCRRASASRSGRGAGSRARRPRRRRPRRCAARAAAIAARRKAAPGGWCCRGRSGNRRRCCASLFAEASISSPTPCQSSRSRHRHVLGERGRVHRDLGMGVRAEKLARLPRRWSDSTERRLRRSTQRYRCGGAWLANVLELGKGNDSSNRAGIALGYRRAKPHFQHGSTCQPRKRCRSEPGPRRSRPQLVAKGSRRFGMVQVAGERDLLERIAARAGWTPGDPAGAARVGPSRRCCPRPFSARSRVHEYGGGEFLVAGEAIYFVNDKDQQVYRIAPGASPAADHRCTRHALCRFRARCAASAADRRRRGSIRGTRGSATRYPQRAASIALSGKAGQIGELATGHDFYASPRLSPDGTQLAFLAWDLPDMPWDSATLVPGARGRRRRGSVDPRRSPAETAAPCSSRSGA